MDGGQSSSRKQIVLTVSGLWCLSSPQRSDGEGIVQLDGEGYAAVGRPTRWNPNISTITFKFRTFSSDALLMYLATEDMVRVQHSQSKTFRGCFCG